MGKIVECKTCKKEVAKGAKVCPHCGQKNPTMKTKDMLIGIAVISAIFIYAIMPDSPNSKEIKKSEYGNKWAFTTDTAKLICYKDGDTNSPVVVVDGKPYGLTGFADGEHGQSDINAINAVWLKDRTTGLNVDLSPFTKEALKLCE